MSITKKEVDKLERHAYAPELNKLWLRNGFSYPTPGCTDIESALVVANVKYDAIKKETTMDEDMESLRGMTFLNTSGPWNIHTRNGHRVMTPLGVRAVEITGCADTAFSIPARCQVKGKWVSGYVTGDDICWAVARRGDDAYVKYLTFRPYQYTDKQSEAVKALTWPMDGSYCENSKAQSDIVSEFMSAHLKAK